jgi:phage terminase large subunit-like protein
MPLDYLPPDFEIDPLRIGQSMRELGITMDTLRDDAHLTSHLVDSLPKRTLEKLLTDWHFLGRDEQIAPPGDWTFWMFLAGRGAGKTRTGAEWVREKIRAGYNRGSLIGSTAGDVRSVMVRELMNVCKPWDRDYKGNLIGYPTYEPSKLTITWANGAEVLLFSAEEPERLRGPQHEFIWMDELAAWKKHEAFEMALFGLRLGDNPQVFISTTPRTKPIMKELLEKHREGTGEVVLSSGNTRDNAANLNDKFMTFIYDRYGGTSLGRQELEGVLLEELEGALWTRAMIDGNRIDAMPTELDDDFYFTRIVVGVDPATKSAEDNDSTGIVVVGLGNNKHAYVLADYTFKGKPAEWGKKVDEVRKLWNADAVVAEVNQGGEMVKFTLETCGVPTGGGQLRMVHASQGKVARAEPVSALYEQGKVHHVGSAKIDAAGMKHEGHLDLLEDQMVQWERDQATYSPDRIDALVWAIYDLLIKDQKTIETTTVKGFF